MSSGPWRDQSDDDTHVCQGLGGLVNVIVKSKHKLPLSTTLEKCQEDQDSWQIESLQNALILIYSVNHTVLSICIKIADSTDHSTNEETIS